MIQVIENNKRAKEGIFAFKDVPVAVINSIRRIMLSDLKCSAFNAENVKIIKNTGTPHNEIVSHRVSMIPVLASGVATVSLNIINTTELPLEVLSTDLHIVTGEAKIFKDIIITTLQKGEELQLVAKVDFNTKQIGGDAYRAITTAYFKNPYAIYASEASKDKLLDYLEESEFTVRQEFPFFEKDDGCIGVSDDMRTLNPREIEAHLGLDNDSISFKIVPNVKVFFIESLFIDAHAILRETIRILQLQLLEFMRTKSEYSFTKNTIDVNCTVTLLIPNASPTILCPLSKYLMMNKDVEFAHYNKKHYQDYTTSLQITFKPNIPWCNAVKVLKNVMKSTYRKIIKATNTLK